MKTADIKKEAEFIKALDSEGDDFKVLSQIFNGFCVGDSGVMEYIPKKTLDHLESTNASVDEIDSMKVKDNFIAIPFPSEFNMENVDFLIFIPNDASGGEGRPEYKNMVLPMSYFLECSSEISYKTKRL